MADQRKILLGLDILQSYKPDGEMWNCVAQLNALFAQGRPPEEMKAEDVNELKEMGWEWIGDGEWKVHT